MRNDYDFDVRDCIPKGKEVPVRTRIIGYEKTPINVYDLTADEEKLFSIPQTRQEIPCTIMIIKTERPNSNIYIPKELELFLK